MPKTIAGPLSGRAFDHVLVIVFENQYRGYVLANPYMRRLARQGIQLGNYFGVMHPSQTNYIASIAGELCNVTSDERPPLLDAAHDRRSHRRGARTASLEGVHGQLRAERDAMDARLRPKDAPPYFVKHNPFSSFSSIVRNEERWRQHRQRGRAVRRSAQRRVSRVRLVHAQYLERRPLDRRNRDRSETARSDPGRPAGALARRLLLPPAFPGSSVASAAADAGGRHVRRVRLRSGLSAWTWRRPTTDPTRSTRSFSPTTSSRASRRRATTTTACCARSSRISASATSARTMPSANWFQFLWGRRFEWSAPQDTSFEVFDGPIAAAGFGGGLFVACAAPDGTVRVRVRSSESRPLVARRDVGGGRLRRAGHGLHLHGARVGGSLSCPVTWRA